MLPSTAARDTASSGTHVRVGAPARACVRSVSDSSRWRRLRGLPTVMPASCVSHAVSFYEGIKGCDVCCCLSWCLSCCLPSVLTNAWWQHPSVPAVCAFASLLTSTMRRVLLSHVLMRLSFWCFTCRMCLCAPCDSVLTGGPHCVPARPAR